MFSSSVLTLIVLLVPVSEMAPLIPLTSSGNCEPLLMSISKRQAFYSGGNDFQIIFAKTIDSSCGEVVIDIQFRYFNITEKSDDGLAILKTQCTPAPITSETRSITCQAPDIAKLLESDDYKNIAKDNTYGVITIEPFNQLYGCKASSDDKDAKLCYSLTVRGSKREIMFPHQTLSERLAASVRSQQSLRYYPNPVPTSASLSLKDGKLEITGSGFVGDNSAAISRLFLVSVVNRADGSAKQCTIDYSTATNDKISCFVKDWDPADQGANNFFAKISAGNWQVLEVETRTI